MRVLRYIITGILLAVMLGLAGYAIFIQKEYDTADLIKFGIAIVGILLSLLHPKKKSRTVNRKTLYAKAYGEYLQNAFSDDKKLEKQLYKAVDFYNNDTPEQALTILQQLQKECKNSTERYAVTVFTALCLDECKQHALAAEQYEAALRLRQSSSIASNLGLCYQRCGNFTRAEEVYRLAIQLDEGNAFAWNNLSCHYFALGNYPEALRYAEEAIQRNEKLPPALGTAAVCCALLKDQESYETYYRRAVSAGYPGEKIKNAIAALDPELT